MTEKNQTQVRDVMTTDLQMVDGLATVADVMAIMVAENIGSVIVEKRDQQDECGLVSVTDIASKVIADNRAVERVSAYEIMTKPVLNIDPDMSIKYAIRLMSDLDVHYALVAEKREVIGMVSFKDMVLRYLI